MKFRFLRSAYFVMGIATIATTVLAAPRDRPGLEWATVVNNNDLMPPLAVRHFNSYNQPSVNKDGLVVIRARSRGGPPLGPPTHGIYTRDMSKPGSEISRVLDKTTRVPHPNNLDVVFVETPSFPRIDISSGTIATRANHKPAHRYHLSDGSETRAGTTGIYTTPFGELITGAAKLGDVPGFGFFGVPEFSELRFEVFPGAPAVTNGNTIVYKGNYTVNGIGKTGIYFRNLENEPAGGTSPAVMIANNTDTLIPGTNTLFGSTAPPSAAGGKVVFAGFDNEQAPALGGIYMAPLEFQPPLTTLVSIGSAVPEGSADEVFTDLGEAGAFDGRFVGFWGSWGEETRTVRLYCKDEGNKDRIAYCNRELFCAATGETLGDANSVCDDPTADGRCYTEKEVPINQGIFVHDTKKKRTHLVARTGDLFDEFLFWNYSGKVPCAGSGHSEEGNLDDAHTVSWRSSSFVAVSSRRGATFRTVFKASAGDVDGIYLRKGPGRPPIVTVLDTTMGGLVLDSEAPADSTILELGIEREGLRGNWLVITSSMGVEGGEEEDGMAGVYATRLR